MFLAASENAVCWFCFVQRFAFFLVMGSPESVLFVAFFCLVSKGVKARRVALFRVFEKFIHFALLGCRLRRVSNLFWLHMPLVVLEGRHGRYFKWRSTTHR